MKTAAFAFLAASASATFVADEELTESIFYPPKHFEPAPVASGLISLPETAIANETYVLFEETFRFAEDGIWTVLHFDEEGTVLPEDDVDACTLKIWSTADEKPQLLNAHTIRQWRYTSAEFTGNEVRVQLMCVGDNPEVMASVAVSGADVGEPIELVDTKTLCASSDRRQATNHAANARYVPGGSCTGWIYNDGNQRCFMTAGHCSGSGRMEFNVPLSGSVSPNDQYSVDSSSIQSSNGGVGNDWKYYGGFPNSNHGQTAYQRQGSAYSQVSSNVCSTSTWSHTGYGTASGSLSLRQKGQPGGNSQTSRSSNRLSYRFDTTGGDSGSPVSCGSNPAPTSGGSFGIHTHGGCTPTGGSNSGTWLGHSSVQNALRSPRGVCSSEGAAEAMKQRYGIHFRGNANAHGPCVFDCAYIN